MEERGPRGIPPTKAFAGAVVLVVFTALLTYGFLRFGGGVGLANDDTLRQLAAQPNWQNFIGAIATARRYYVTPIGPEMLNKMLAGAATGAIGALGDPYSGFFDETQFRQSQMEARGEYAGIGVTVDEKDGYTIVINAFPGSPAATTAFLGATRGDPLGLRAGDRFKEVDGKSVVGMPVTDVADLVRGAAGSKVSVTILRGDRELVFPFTRRKVVIPTAESKLFPGRIGYLHVTGFNDQTPDQVRQQLAALQSQGATALVLDLRNNPGGVVQAATQVAGDFLGPGLVTYLVRRDGRRDDYRASNERVVGVPFVVLVNQYSASAAELVAGAIQDSGRAPLVGEHTFGKFIVQVVYPLQDNTGVKLTVARYYTPKGRNLQKQGLTPDYPVAYPSELPPDAFGDPAQDPQLARAMSLLRSAA